MCLGIPGEIVEIVPERPDLAVVDVVGVRRTVNIGLLTDDEAKPGAWVLVHVGFAMSRIDELEAAATLELLTGLGQAYTDELDALANSDID
jgi:hydrogenase expression/formation protein HypC